MSEERYTLAVWEGNKRLSDETLPDPFHHTTIRPRGWRVAWAVLRRRYEVRVVVSADSERIEEVMELNSDYLGPRGSKSRTQWDAQLQGALGRFGSEREVELKPRAVENGGTGGESSESS